MAAHLIQKMVSLIRLYERVPVAKQQPEPVFFAFYHCMRLSPQLVQVAKEKELVSKLFGLLNMLYDVSGGEPRQNPQTSGQELNLNQLISLSNFRVVVDAQNTNNNSTNMPQCN